MRRVGIWAAWLLLTHAFSPAVLADYLADRDLRRAIAGKVLKAKTARDGDDWQVRMGSTGRAEFTFANGMRRLARWQVAGRGIEFTFDREKSCRSIFLAADKKQEWRDCDDERVSSYIVAPIFTASVASEAQSASAGSLERKLRVEAQALAAQGYEILSAHSSATVTQSSPLHRSLDLMAGATYALIATCDERCSHVEIVLRSPDGRILAQSPEQHDTVIVAGPSAQTGRHEVVVRSPGCAGAAGLVALQVMKLKAN